MNKNIIAVNIGKTIALGLKLFNFGSGTSMPGLIAKKISPQILSDLINQTQKEIICVTGTNGKTTTSNFVSSILRSANRFVAHNAKGANMPNGIITTMVENANFFGKFRADNTVLETDEAYLHILADYFCADYLIITNLFRDQLDRYGEVDTTAKMIRKAIDKFKLQSYEKAHHLNNPPIFTSIINADDPNLQSLADENSIYFGFEDIIFENGNKNTTEGNKLCKCGQQFNYSKIYYGDIGHYSCSCGIKRPKTYLSATAKIFSDFSVLDLTNEITGEKFEVKVNLPGVYNAYNALAAITLAVKLGIKQQDIQNGLQNYKTAFGRAEKKLVKGKQTIIQLIKNPVGAQQALQTVINNPDANIFFCINDNYADGRDVSWLWDVDFEALKNHRNKIIVSGSRYADMALRLKYAGMPTENIVPEKDLKKALDFALDNTSENNSLYIFPSYTALMGMKKSLK